MFIELTEKDTGNKIDINPAMITCLAWNVKEECTGVFMQGLENARASVVETREQIKEQIESMDFEVMDYE